MEKYYKVIPSDELYHFGIKGQKWGSRRFQNEDGTYTSEGKMRRREGSEYSRYKKDTSLKNLRKMSDADLDSKISRLKKEKEYKELRYSQLSRGRRFMDDVLSNSSNKALKAILAGVFVFTGRVMVDSILKGAGADIKLPKK